MEYFTLFAKYLDAMWLVNDRNYSRRLYSFIHSCYGHIRVDR